MPSAANNFKPQSLSVVLAVHNEAANLDRCLSAVKPLKAEIIVVDGGSTDATVPIAKRLGAKVIRTTNKPMFHINKQMAIDAAQGDWILQLDADEVVDNAMLHAIETVLSQPKHPFAAYYLKRKNYFLGAFLLKGGQYPDMVIRFFRRGLARLPQRSVHEQMEVDGQTGVLDGHLLHYNAPTFQRYITNANRYTSLTAQNLKDKRVRLNFFNDCRYLIWYPLKTFLVIFLRHRGYVDGFRGFAFALFSGLHHALAYMKLYDLYAHEHRH